MFMCWLGAVALDLLPWLVVKRIAWWVCLLVDALD